MNNVEALKDLRADTDLHNRMKIFIHDLRTFGNNPQAQECLELNTARYYLLDLYFTFLETLELKFLNKAVTDHYVCTSHDLAPVFQEVFDIQKGYHEGKSFKAAYKKFEKLYSNKSNKD